MQFRLQRHGVGRGTGVVITVGIPTKIPTKMMSAAIPSHRRIRHHRFGFWGLEIIRRGERL